MRALTTMTMRQSESSCVDAWLTRWLFPTALNLLSGVAIACCWDHPISFLSASWALLLTAEAAKKKTSRFMISVGTVLLT